MKCNQMVGNAWIYAGGTCRPFQNCYSRYSYDRLLVPT